MKKIKNYKTGEFAALLGIHVKTLQRLDRTNIFKAYRTKTNRRYYTYEQYKDFLNYDLYNK